MDFLIDIGNSRIKWGIGDKGQLTNTLGAAPHPQGRFDLFAKSYWAEMAAPKRVVIASVAPLKFLTKVTTWIERRWNIPPWVVESPASGLGVENAYRDAARLGCDRWAVLVAAHARYPVNACIVDCGTAITIDAVSAAGVHQGGLITPGITMMRNALAAKAPGIELGDNNVITQGSHPALLGRDTVSGVIGGTLYTAISVIDRVVADVKAELGAPMVCLITGGDAPAVLPLLAGEFDYRPHLVLEGLAVMATTQ